ELKVAEIHLVNRVELGLKLLGRAINVGVIHLQRTNSHETEEFAALLVAMTKAVFSQAKWQVAITAWQGRIKLVMMRAIHWLEVVAIRGQLRSHLRCPSQNLLQALPG